MRSTPSPLTLSLSKGEPLMVRLAHHERSITSLRILSVAQPLPLTLLWAHATLNNQKPLLAI